MGGGGPDTVTQTTKSEPWAGAVPMLTDVMGELGGIKSYWQDFFKNNPGGWAYGGQTIADLTPDQMQAGNYIKSLANPEYFNPQYQWAQDQMSKYGGGADQGIGQAAGALNRFTSGEFLNSAEKGINSAWNNALQPTVEGQMLSPDTNPWFKNAVQAANDQTRRYYDIEGTKLNASMPESVGNSSAWALLKSENEKNAAKQIADTSNQMYAQNYGNERGRQMDAANQLMNYYTQQQGLQQGATGQAGDLFKFVKGLEGSQIGNINDLLNQAWKGAGNLAAWGETQQGQQQARLNAAKDNWNEQIWTPFNLLSSLGNAAMTGGQAGGVHTSQSPYFQPSFAQQLLGTGMQVGNLANAFGAFK